MFSVYPDFMTAAFQIRLDFTNDAFVIRLRIQWISVIVFYVDFVPVADKDFQRFGGFIHDNVVE